MLTATAVSSPPAAGAGRMTIASSTVNAASTTTAAMIPSELLPDEARSENDQRDQPDASEDRDRGSSTARLRVSLALQARRLERTRRRSAPRSSHRRRARSRDGAYPRATRTARWRQRGTRRDSGRAAAKPESRPEHRDGLRARVLAWAARRSAAAAAARLEPRPAGRCRAPHAPHAHRPACRDAAAPTGLRTSIVCVGVFGHRRGMRTLYGATAPWRTGRGIGRLAPPTAAAV